MLLAAIEDCEKSNVRLLGIWFAVMGIFPCLTINITWKKLNNKATGEGSSAVTDSERSELVIPIY